MTEPLAFELVEDDATFADVLSTLLEQEVYALDTEFHRERTYYPRLALVQVAWPGGLALIDPTTIDLRPLAKLLRSDSLLVAHAADQDLEVLQHVCGELPARLFDTQLAAGFLGMASPSLGALYERELGIRPPKADRLTDWLRRPLSTDQLEYAATDVAYLLEVYGSLVAQLEERGRLQWAIDECEVLRLRARGIRDPDEAWRRIKEARHLRGKARSVAQAVAGWRERRAANLDQPVRYVMPDLAIVGIAQRPPKQADGLRRIHGMEGRGLSDSIAAEIMKAVAQGQSAPPPADSGNIGRELDRDLRPAVGLVSAWVSQLARDLDLDTSLLATRNDLESFLRGDEDARLAVGWRAGLVGERIRRLVDGEAALAFAGGGQLVLEERSRNPL